MKVDEFLRKYSWEKIEFIKDDNLFDYIKLTDYYNDSITIPCPRLHLHPNNDILDYLDYFIENNINDPRYNNSGINYIKKNYNLIKKWNPILISSPNKISEKYFLPISLMFERLYNQPKQNSIIDENENEQINLISMSLMILSKINNLDKIEFTNNQNICDKITIKTSFNPYDYTLVNFDPTDMINSQIIDNISNYINNVISDEGGIIIYNIIDCLYKLQHPGDFHISHVCNGTMMGFKKSRFAKILKIKQKINEKI